MSETRQLVSDTGITKAGKSFAHLFLLGILAGAYIALAAAGSMTVACNLLANPETFGLGRCLAGIIFSGGLILVMIAGAELFTGNTMMLLPLAQRRITFYAMLRNWSIVYAGNFAGSIFVALLVCYSGQLYGGSNLVGGVTIAAAATKCSLTFWEAFLLGILCNWLVCLAIWMAASAKDVAGKILVILFPIWLFVAAGFEHSVANMYFIPAGLFAAQFPALIESAATIVQPEVLESLTWINFFATNLLPVTLGNIIGGGVFVALAYGYVCRKT